MTALLSSLWRQFGVDYRPDTTERPFLVRAVSKSEGSLQVTVAVPDGAESRRFFGAPMARHSLQPVWIHVKNGESAHFRLLVRSVSDDYYTPLEAAAACHYSSGKALLGFGALAWLFLPVLLVLPVRFVRSRRANRRMDAHFHAHALALRPIAPGGEISGFVFTPLDVGLKEMRLRFVGPEGEREVSVSIPVPGLDADHLQRDLESAGGEAPVECDLHQLARRLAEMPQATTNAAGTGAGDPVNLVVIGRYGSIRTAFGGRWDETESITFATAFKTTRSFLSGAEYRYSPVSPLYLFGRSQDFALQRVRTSINERLHLRLWRTPLTWQGRPVWVGQVSRDIGVRFTLKTWNLTTHRIDPNVDESRDYVTEDLFDARRVEIAAHVEGVGPCGPDAPRRNLTGDPYFTDGQRAVIAVSDRPGKPRFVAWQGSAS